MADRSCTGHVQASCYEQYSPDYRDEAAGADNEGILPENRTEHPLSQAGSGYPFSSIVPKQTFCSAEFNLQMQQNSD